MFVYSPKIIQFLGEIKRLIKDVLAQEAGLRVFGNRFYNREQTASYPIHSVVYNNKSPLAYFNADFYELGFHECLMHANKKQLKDIVRHEVAHYLAFIEHGEVAAHGAEFKRVCEQMGWGEDVSRATICLEGAESVGKVESSVLRKVQKLMALATSSNKHEAESAMIKSRELLLTHNIESTYVGIDEELLFLKRILKQKKETAKMRCIAKILETFFVSTVYNRAGGFIYLEILGTAVNVEIAEYVALFLEDALEQQWQLAKDAAGLKGAVAKNSFFMGLAKGYCNKIEALKKDHAQALMVIERKLTDAKQMVYSRLTQGKSGGGYCRESSQLGEKMGRELTINPVLKKTSEFIYSLT